LIVIPIDLFNVFYKITIAQMIKSVKHDYWSAESKGRRRQDDP
jgi:hypothetical protein